jgi:hypothetical protein
MDEVDSLLSARSENENGTQFTSFTGTKVQILQIFDIYGRSRLAAFGALRK